MCVSLRRPPCSLTPCPVLAQAVAPGAPSAPPHLQPPTPTEACPRTHPLPVTCRLHRRLPDMADYSYSSAPRPCGGSHTLTYPYRRIRLQHLSQGLYPTEEIQIAMKVGTFLGASREGPQGPPDSQVPPEKLPAVPCPALGLGGSFLIRPVKPQVLFLSWEEDSHPGHLALSPSPCPCP